MRWAKEDWNFCRSKYSYERFSEEMLKHVQRVFPGWKKQPAKSSNEIEDMIGSGQKGVG